VTSDVAWLAHKLLTWNTQIMMLYVSLVQTFTQATSQRPSSLSFMIMLRLGHGVSSLIYKV